MIFLLIMKFDFGFGIILNTGVFEMRFMRLLMVLFQARRHCDSFPHSNDSHAEVESEG